MPCLFELSALKHVGSVRQDLLWQAQTCGMTWMLLLEWLPGVAALRAPLSFRLLGGM